MPIGIAQVGSSVASGIAGAGAIGNAQAGLNNAAAQGNAILQTTQAQTTGNLQPYVNTGQTYNSALAGLLGVGGNPAASASAFGNYLGSTNYQFQLGQGEQAIDTAAAPAFNSGATAKALNNYAQGQAGSALSGYENLLSTGVGQGIVAGSSLATASNNNAAAQSSNLLQAASGDANLDITGLNSLNNALKGGISGLSSFGSGGTSALAGLFGGSSSSAGNAFNAPGYAPFAATAPLI